MNTATYKITEYICDVVDEAISSFDRYYLKGETIIFTCIQGWSGELYKLIRSGYVSGYHYSYIIRDNFELIKEIITNELVMKYNINVDALKIYVKNFDYGDVFGASSYEIMIEYNKLGLEP